MKMMQPRILVISNNALSSENANGKTLAALLHNFSKENIAQFYIRPEVPDTDVAGKCFRITDREKLKSVFGRHQLLGSTVIPLLSEKGSNTKFSSLSEKILFSKKKLIESGFARYVRELIWKNKKGSFDGLYRFIEDFHPDVVLLYASRSAFMIDIAVELAKKYSLPLMIYTSEDEYFHKVSWFKFYAQKCLKMLKKSYNQAVQIAASVITNHEKLTDLFHTEFDVPVKTIFLSSSVKPSTQPINGETPYFLYAGNVSSALKRKDSLIDIANTLGKINPKYHLDVFPTNASKRTLRILKRNQSIVLHEPVPAKQLAEIIDKATIVFHCESFNRKIKGLITNSFSSKIPDLLGSSRPTLVYAPEYCAFYQYLKTEEATVLAASKSKLEKGIRNIIESSEYRQYLGEQSLLLFRKNHQLIDNGIMFYKEVEKAREQMKKPINITAPIRKLRLNHWLTPVLFVYFIFSLFPTILPNIAFLPNIFSSSLIELAWKGALFIGLSVFFSIIFVFNHLKFNWKLAIPIAVYAIANLVVIALIPSSTILSSLNTGTLLEYEVIITTATKIAGLFQVLSTVVLTYIFFIILPKTILFKRQLFLLFYLMLGFLVISGFYSIIFEKGNIIALFTSDNPYLYNIHSFFEDKNTYGKYLLGGIMISCYLASQSRFKWQFGITALLFAFLVTTLSKTPIIAAAGLFVLLFIYYVFVRFERNIIFNSFLLLFSLILIVYLGCLLTIPALQILPINSTIYHYLTVSVFQYGIGTVDSRVLIWQAAINLLQGWHLFFGYGEKIANIFLTGNVMVFNNYESYYFHNGLLQVANIGGLLYLALYLALFVYLFVVYFKIGKNNKDSRFVFIAMFITFCVHATFEEAILSSTSVYSFMLSMVLIVAPIMTFRMQKTDYIAELKRDVATDEPGNPVLSWPLEKPVTNDLNEIPMAWYKKELNRRFKNRMIKKIAKEEKYNLKMQKWREKHAWNE